MTEGARVPKLRFQGFNAPWENRQALSLFIPISDKGYPNLPVLSATQEHGMIIRDDTGINIQHDRRNEIGYKRVQSGNFVIHLRSFQGGFAHSSLEGITSPAYTVFGFKNTSEQHDRFWKHIFKSKIFIKRLETVTYGIRDGRSIKFNDFNELDFLLPSIQEQQCIASLLDIMEQVTLLNQKHYKKLVELKQAMLQKMFPREGETVPELRFPGFTEPWQKENLKGLCSFSKGYGFSKSDLTDNGTPVILYGRLYTNYQAEISNVDTFVKPTPNAVFSRGGEILIPSSGETAEDIAVAAVVKNSGIIIGGDLNILVPNTGINPLFLATTLSFGSPRKQLSEKAQGKSVVHLHNSEIASTNVRYPSLKEQKAIGQFFTALDDRIAKMSRRVDKLKQLKQALLEKMFV